MPIVEYTDFLKEFVGEAFRDAPEEIIDVDSGDDGADSDGGEVPD